MSPRYKQLSTDDQLISHASGRMEVTTNVRVILLGNLFISYSISFYRTETLLISNDSFNEWNFIVS